MQILCHRKDRKVGKEIKMLGRGVGRILSWVGEYTPLLCKQFSSLFEVYNHYSWPAEKYLARLLSSSKF